MSFLNKISYKYLIINTLVRIRDYCLFQVNNISFQKTSAQADVVNLLLKILIFINKYF